MSRGHADWDIVTKDRLAPMITWDRRGEVIWNDIFEFGVASWSAISTPAGGTLAANTTEPLYGENSMLMTTAGSGTNLIEAHRYFNPPKLAKWGAAVGVAFTSDFKSFTLEVDRLTDDTIYYAALKVNKDAGELQFMNSTGAFEKIADIQVPTLAQGLYHRIKLVVDFENLEYVRVLYDQNEYDLGGEGLFSGSTGVGPYNRTILSFLGRTGETDTAKVDAFVATINEQ